MSSVHRHIYNNSGGAWTFQAYNDDPDGHGNVDFEGDGSGTVQNGPWMLQPNTSVQVEYTTTAGSIMGTWGITDSNGNQQTFTYGNGGASDAPYINHSGNTGAANLNDPANGDINMGGNTW